MNSLEKESPKHHHKPAIGIFFVICACFFNACMATMVKIIVTNYPVPNQVLVFTRFGISFLLILPLLLLPKNRPVRKVLKVQIWQPHAVRICFGILALYSYFYAIQHIALSNAVLLMNTAPLFIPFVLWVWRGVIIPGKLWWGLIVGFIGVFFILGPTLEHLNLGYLIGVFGGLNAGIAYVAARLQSYNDRPICINFYFFLFTGLISFLLCARTFCGMVSTFDLRLWFYLILLGIFGASFQGFIILAVKWAQIRFLSVFLYLSVVFAMINNWIIFKKVPAITSLIGLLLVCLGAILMTLLDPMRQKTANQESGNP